MFCTKQVQVTYFKKRVWKGKYQLPLITSSLKGLFAHWKNNFQPNPQAHQKQF